jgi:hypothetical protein
MKLSNFTANSQSSATRYQSQYRPDCVGILKARWNVDSGAIGQCHHGADPGDRHQAPAHGILSHDRQQASVQDADLLKKHPPNNEQRSGWFSTSSLMRASNFTVPAMPTLKPNCERYRAGRSGWRSRSTIS